MKSENVSRAVVEAIADAKDVSPLDVNPPLYNTIDPDALEQFVASVDGRTAAAVEVRFTYAGYEVTVTGDGRVAVEAE